jgi:hypothetical protein
MATTTDPTTLQQFTSEETTSTEPGDTAPSWPTDPAVDVTIDDDIWEREIGDRVWIDGTEYTVVGEGISFMSPASKLVIGESGEQHKLVAGTIRGEDAEGVTWVSQVSDKDINEISSDDILAPYSKVYVTETSDSLEHYHEIIPDSDTRECPICGETAGRLQRSEIQNDTVVEVRWCSNTDCNSVYRHEQQIDPDDEAELIVRDDDAGRFRLKITSGFYEVEDQDDFKFPLDTHDGKHDGYRTATQIADFLNPKMVTPGINDLLRQDVFTADELLELVADQMEESDEVDAETVDPDGLPIADEASDMTGRELLTSEAFYEFVTDAITVFGDVSHLNSDDYEWKTEDEITWWDDVRRYEKKMEITYTEFTRDDNTQNDFRVGHQWRMDKYDLTRFIC